MFPSLCHAQTGQQFIPGEKVIFIDSFVNDTIGSFPQRWQNKNSYYEGKIDSDHGNKVFEQVFGDVQVHPILNKRATSKEYVTFECDIRITDTARSFVSIAFSSKGNDTLEKFFGTDHNYYCWGTKAKDQMVPSLSFALFNSVHHGEQIEQALSERTGRSFSRFDPSAWHHVALRFTKAEVNLYLDNKMVDAKIPPYIPEGFSIGGHAPYVIKNIKFLESDHVPYPQDIEGSFNSDMEFLHAIHFDVNSSVVKNENVTFINEISGWLKSNPSTKLEIEGHADNEGDEVANIKLSQARAEAVKQQLVYLGIDRTRLSTRGFGTSKPIRSNATDEGRAENSRVEFRKSK
jgi:outer membrane protein OmpA-like peptidoglycan-associated protein